MKAIELGAVVERLDPSSLSHHIEPMAMKDELASWLMAEMGKLEAEIALERERESHALALGNHRRSRYHLRGVDHRNVKWNTLDRVLAKLNSLTATG